MPFVVLYDANVLWGDIQRDLLIRVAQSGLVQAKWSDQILDETFKSIREKRPDLPAAKLDRTRALMCRAVRDSLVTGYESLVGAVELPDADDRHVLAAAIKAGAQVIVTWNLKHFPADALVGWNIEAKTPDDFVLDQLHLDPGWFTVRSSRWPTSGGTRPSRSPTSWRPWSGAAWSRPPYCFAGLRACVVDHSAGRAVPMGTPRDPSGSPLARRRPTR